jgi:hypothetical protein
MAQCAAFVDGVLTPMPEPCTALVLLTPAEYSALSQNPFILSPEDGLLLSGAVVGVWAAAFGVRAAIRALGGNDDGETS